MSILKLHARLETNALLLTVAILVVAAIGGLAEIAPLFTIQQTVEDVSGTRPYSPLEQAGRDIYVREGCHLCHSQMVRPSRDDVDRYGHYSLAAESMYDHPFQWGASRIGPDLARIGGKYTDSWHIRHFINPRDVVPSSIMPSYGYLRRPLDTSHIVADMVALRQDGIPYTEDDIAHALGDLKAQATDGAAATDLLARYPKAVVGKKDRTSQEITEMDALVAYLQVLGTMADFSTMKPEAIR